MYIMVISLFTTVRDISWLYDRLSYAVL